MHRYGDYIMSAYGPAAGGSSTEGAFEFKDCVAKLTTFLSSMSNPAERSFLAFKCAAHLSQGNTALRLQLEDDLMAVTKAKEKRREAASRGVRERRTLPVTPGSVTAGYAQNSGSTGNAAITTAATATGRSAVTGSLSQQGSTSLQSRAHLADARAAAAATAATQASKSLAPVTPSEKSSARRVDRVNANQPSRSAAGAGDSPPVPAGSDGTGMAVTLIAC